MNVCCFFFLPSFTGFHQVSHEVNAITPRDRNITRSRRLCAGPAPMMASVNYAQSHPIKKIKKLKKKSSINGGVHPITERRLAPPCVSTPRCSFVLLLLLLLLLLFCVSVRSKKDPLVRVPYFPATGACKLSGLIQFGGRQLAAIGLSMAAIGRRWPSRGRDYRRWGQSNPIKTTVAIQCKRTGNSLGHGVRCCCCGCCCCCCCCCCCWSLITYPFDVYMTEQYC